MRGHMFKCGNVAEKGFGSPLAERDRRKRHRLSQISISVFLVLRVFERLWVALA